jgi:hypothetical protein
MPALCELQKKGLTQALSQTLILHSWIEAQKYADVPIVVNARISSVHQAINTAEFSNNHHIIRGVFTLHEVMFLTMI